MLSLAVNKKYISTLKTIKNAPDGIILKYIPNLRLFFYLYQTYHFFVE